MRNTVPLRWIEIAEAKRVVNAALFERASGPSWYQAAHQTMSSWLAQPAVPRRPASREQPPRADDSG